MIDSRDAIAQLQAIAKRIETAKARKQACKNASKELEAIGFAIASIKHEYPEIRIVPPPVKKPPTRTVQTLQRIYNECALAMLNKL